MFSLFCEIIVYVSLIMKLHILFLSFLVVLLYLLNLKYLKMYLFQGPHWEEGHLFRPDRFLRDVFNNILINDDIPNRL